MPEQSSPINAFSPRYLDALRQKDEPEGSEEAENGGPLVLRQAGPGFALFRPWKSLEAGDSPEASFDTREDALLFLAARSALRRLRLYRLCDPEGASPGEGYPVEKEGEARGRLRSFNPDWIYAAHVLASVARSPEDLAALLEAAGPTGQEQIGQILGRNVLWNDPTERGEGGKVDTNPG